FKYLDDRTVVLILSDGLDTGNTDNLEFAMKKIQLHAAKVIWLNPLAGSPNYQPETKGMKVAMPYIDVFAPAPNLESLRALARHIH
ncbi:MAG: VWA domain-containing protein, partial [Bacteroidetes bacterium]|nr:VWA domain-containing protein [Bacteroidota bacterium]